LRIAEGGLWIIAEQERSQKLALTGNGPISYKTKHCNIDIERLTDIN
jgi:hypothetical protein